jgi:DNA-directed RNA polymerase specialized sigma24 family protein
MDILADHDLVREAGVYLRDVRAGSAGKLPDRLARALWELAHRVATRFRDPAPEDVAQQALERMLAWNPDFQTGHSTDEVDAKLLLAVARRTAVRLCLDRKRRSKPLPEDPNYPIGSDPPTESLVSARLCLEQLLRVIPDPVLPLLGRGLSATEIADELGISMANAYQQISRMRKRIYEKRELLGECADFLGGRL